MSRCVLVVEDEILVNMFTSSELRAAGCEVLALTTPMRRLGFLRIVPISISSSLPGSMDGLKLAATVRYRWPPIKILITSGKSAPDSEQMPVGSAFILKPYEIPDLLKTIYAHLV